MEALLSVENLVYAYANGIFPMDVEGELAWFSPDPRCIIALDGLRVSRSLRQALRPGRFDVRIDADFDAVIHACADRPAGTWISQEIIDAYTALHEAGFAHTVACYCEGQLAGGLYGVSIRGAFFGESMFHRVRDASKVALVHLVERMKARGLTLLDVQWQTPHLKRLGAIEIPRDEYLKRLEAALELSCTFAD